MKRGDILIAFRLPEDFLFGVATAPAQVEGGNTPHSWMRWSAAKGRVKDGTSTGRANDHWNRVDEDLDLAQSLGIQTLRLGIEWARIEPRPGFYEPEVLIHYRREIEGLLTRGIRPLVTLHHFSNPLWFEDSGGWMRGDADRLFAAYVRFVVEGLGDLVSDWITINEPSVYLIQGFVFGIWPPGHNSLPEYIRGRRNLVRAHRAAYAEIHRVRIERGWDRPESPTKVGVAHHLRVFQAKARWNPLARLLCRVLEWATQGTFLKAMSGKSRSDFLGVNYYTRDTATLSPRPAELFLRLGVPENAKRNDLGWEIYPEGISRVVRKVHKRWKMPVWITENGCADAADSFREAFIVDHLREISACISEGIPVERYYHWTLMDNFEWAEGESARFGLIEVDFETQRRRLRDSAQCYARMSRSKSWEDPQNA